MSKLSIASFTNVGYRLHSRNHVELDTDMSGKTVLISGATGGLGLSTAAALSRLGARTLIVGRNSRKLELAARSIGGDVVAHHADLSLMQQVRALAELIRSTEQRIDVLVNNVGVLMPERTVTEEGIETTLATNLAGHFLLTNLLASRLIESTPARVINVASGGMYSERIRPDDLQFKNGRYTGTAAYARTKRGQVILTEMWAQRFEGTGVVVHSMHPGWARTAGVESSLPTFYRLMGPLLRTSDQGADTIVWLATAPEVVETSGRFWFDRRPAPTHILESTRESDQDRRSLWDNLVQLTRSDFAMLNEMVA